MERIPAIERPKVHPTAEQFDAYVEGNMRLPQTGFGIAVLLAREVAKGSPSDLERFMTTKLSDEQMEYIRTAMNRAHAIIKLRR